MAEYIERAAMIYEMSEAMCGTGYQQWAIDVIKRQPAADVAEVKHGEWLKTDAFPHKVFCSLCYRTYVTNEEVIQERNSQHPCYCTEAEYCPHCGAKMDGKEQAE